MRRYPDMTLLAAAGFLMTPQLALADPADGRFYGHHGMMDWGGWFVGTITMVIFFALLVGAIVLVVRLLGGGQFNMNGPRNDQAGDRALAILRERFARGEISAEEFATAKKTLEH